MVIQCKIELLWGGFSLKDDKKDLNVLKDEISEAADQIAINEDNFSNAVDKSKDYSNKALDDELERLAQTFQQELKKAQAMTEEELIKSGIIIQEYEDDDGIIPEEELCRCCGERRRDKSFGENYEYCRKCREAMRRYPLSVPGIIALAAMVFVAVVSVLGFVSDYSVYNTIHQAEKYISEKKMFSALVSYDEAIETLESANIEPKKLYLKTARLVYATMPEGVGSFSDVNSRIGKALSNFELDLPIFSGYKSLNKEMLTLQSTFAEFYNLVNSEEYADYDLKDDKNYEELMTAVGSLIDKEVSISAGENATELVKADKSVVRFCQYMIAYTAGKYDDTYKYMNEVYELNPSYLWLYAYELGITELQRGNEEKAEMFANALYKSNIEMPEAYVIYSSIERMTGDTKKAIEWADKGINAISDNVELYRMKAMALAAKGDYEGAKKVVDKGLEKQQYSYLYMVSLVIENELGNKDKVKEIKDVMKEEKLEISERTKNYLKGEITAKEMFTEGTGDVE